MLFHSEVFLLAFLPATLAGYYLCARHGGPRLWLLLAASLLFYGYWDPRLLPLLAGSILANWLIARASKLEWMPLLIGAGVAVNLALIAIFKYADFVGGTAAWLAGFTHERWSIVLPLAISFFTFQQISYLVDLGRGRAPVYSLRDYALYVSFFPQLIAGPIVRHHEMIPQFAADPLRPGLDERLGRGFAMFTVGLAKKVILADGLAPLSDGVFDKALAGTWIAVTESWIGLLAFTFQVYFDFSGYSDMAIGLALMFGLTLPLNFAAPYQATSIRDFWRRWHMTLMRFFRDYLYRPVGLSLHGPLREPVAVMATMMLVGLWHGAAWTYVLFGAAHGLALVVNQLWRDVRPERLALPAWLGWLMTFGFFTLSMSLFRSQSLPATLAILEAAVRGGTLHVGWLGQGQVGLMIIAAGVAFFAPTSQKLVLERSRPTWFWPLGSSVALVYLILGSLNADPPAFVYFQF